MENPAVVRPVEVAWQVGLATLRFNFRGVGGSAGAHDEGVGEQADLRAALHFLADRLAPGLPLGLAGYSFGAWVAARIARTAAGDRPETGALCLIAPPLAMSGFDFLEGWEQATLLVAGSRDQYCPAADLERLAGRLKDAECVIVDGADHFFFGRLFPLGAAVGRWARRWAAA